MHTRIDRRMDDEYPVEEISLDDVDLTIKACGHWKCFSLSKSNPRLGYQLIRNGDVEHYRKQKGADQTRKVRTFRWFVNRFRFAECVKTHYDINHIVGLPKVTELTEEIVERMKFPENSIHPSVERPFLPGEIIILPVEYNPNFVLFHIPGQFNDLVEHMNKYMPQNPDYYPNFIAQMHKLDETISENVGCLSMDFQGFVDEHGIFYLFDVDTCGGPQCSAEYNNIHPDLRERLIHPLQETLSELMQIATAVKDHHFPAEIVRNRKQLL